jgi:predicted porin
VLGDAGALLAASASAQAGITIPAGDWTIDIGGNVNAFYTMNRADRGGCATINGGIANCVATGTDKNATNINTGLLPSAIGLGGKTRQNDLDVAFQFTFFPGVSSGNTTDSSFGGNSLNIRQAYLTFGDASWGTVKMGRDLGIFAADAILNDMTLLGVGSLGYGSGNTTLGRIGTGFIYTDWNAQFSYASPNWNGFSFKAGVFDPWSGTSDANPSLLGLATGGNANVKADTTPQYQGSASYDFSANEVTGKVWVSGLYQKFDSADSAKAWDIGAKASVGGLTAVAYYYDAEAVGTTGFGVASHASVGGKIKGRDSDGWYTQVTYALPTVGTKIGLAYGESKLDRAKGETNANLVKENNMWTLGAYHPLTKSLNLVAEYNVTESKNHSGGKNEDKGVSLGAILFF